MQSQSSSFITRMVTYVEMVRQIVESEASNNENA